MGRQMSLNTSDLTHVCNLAIAEHRKFCNSPWLVKPSIPIPFFGDVEEYLSSTIKVVTVGLNPSLVEFKEDRFGVDYDDVLTSEALVQYLSGYFDFNPYSRWFDKSFESLLQPLSTSFYGSSYPGNKVPKWWDTQPNTALHTDICSPLATDPTWSKLNPEVRLSLEGNGFEIWCQLIEVLKPHLILISVAKKQLSMFPNLNWQSLIPFGNGEDRHKMLIADFNGAKIVWGRSQVTPFFHLTIEQRQYAAENILKELGC